MGEKGFPGGAKSAREGACAVSFVGLSGGNDLVLAIALGKCGDSGIIRARSALVSLVVERVGRCLQGIKNIFCFPCNVLKHALQSLAFGDQEIS